DRFLRSFAVQYLPYIRAFQVEHPPRGHFRGALLTQDADQLTLLLSRGNLLLDGLVSREPHAPPRTMDNQFTGIPDRLRVHQAGDPEGRRLPRPPCNLFLRVFDAAALVRLPGGLMPLVAVRSFQRLVPLSHLDRVEVLALPVCGGCRLPEACALPHHLP